MISGPFPGQEPEGNVGQIDYVDYSSEWSDLLPTSLIRDWSLITGRGGGATKREGGGT